MKPLCEFLILLVASLTVAQTLSTLAQTQSSSTDSPKDLVFIGTITKIYPFSAPASVRRRWTVRTHVDRVVSGTFSGDTFTFTVHSPAQSGLRVGRAYTIKATWTTDGYVVDESTLRTAGVGTKRSPKRGFVTAGRNITNRWTRAAGAGFLTCLVL